MTILEEIPLLFTPAMALRAARGNKTQTRRVITSANSLFDGAPAAKYAWDELHWDQAWIDDGPSPAGNPGPYLKVPRTWKWDGSQERTVHRIYPRYQVGVKLWVRENWWTLAKYDHLSPGKLPSDAPIWYARDWIDSDLRQGPWGRVRPNIHLPRQFCGMELEVVACRPEHIQEITDADAEAEGADPGRGPIHTPLVGNRNGYWHAFRALWDAINAPRGYGWDENPRVWVVTFKTLRVLRSAGA